MEGVKHLKIVPIIIINTLLYHKGEKDNDSQTHRACRSFFLPSSLLASTSTTLANRCVGPVAGNLSFSSLQTSRTFFFLWPLVVIESLVLCTPAAAAVTKSQWMCNGMREQAYGWSCASPESIPKTYFTSQWTLNLWIIYERFNLFIVAAVAQLKGPECIPLHRVMSFSSTWIVQVVARVITGNWEGTSNGQ